MIQQFFKKLFDQFLEKQEEEIIAKLCFWIVYYYISVPKYMVNSSGILVHMNQTHEGYTYDTIGDFLREYSGKTRGAFYFESRIYYIKFEEMIREKCREMIYAYYFPRFIDGHSLLCKELLREIGVCKIEIECGSFYTLIFNYCTETKDWVDEYEENVLKELFVLSLPFIVQAYGINVCKYIKQEENRKEIECLVH
ncbi:hypothetical protein [Bacillus pseudomycoides]|uniref:hypothetical protein n=1 Tax=Bacillus pseudomycoides TaxID=64104 RepID=UPI000BF98D41|nr:hypothetical protein [Bacillus pseudomycoides]PGE95096.1 hypothetical protein COM62_21200 [Bacillus pseudomycoides]PHB25605.1 hypothetical protein COE80_15975 [Bacillus pseudomycoides]PHE37943.1 hypothetical protein COF51_14305 [Bacillus pseudomycoides]